MYKKPVWIVTEIKWKASEVNGRNILVMIDSGPIPATLEIENEEPLMERGKQPLLKRMIGVRLEKKKQDPIRFAVNLKATRPVAGVVSDYYLSQVDWDILVKSNFAESISPKEPKQ